MSPRGDFFQHPNALVESESISERTRIWAFAHVLPGARIGADCNICDGVFVEAEADGTGHGNLRRLAVGAALMVILLLWLAWSIGGASACGAPASGRPSFA